MFGSVVRAEITQPATCVGIYAGWQFGNFTEDKALSGTTWPLHSLRWLTNLVNIHWPVLGCRLITNVALQVFSLHTIYTRSSRVATSTPLCAPTWAVLALMNNSNCHWDMRLIPTSSVIGMQRRGHQHIDQNLQHRVLHGVVQVFVSWISATASYV